MKILVTININDVLHPESRASMQAAAARWNCEFVELTEKIAPAIGSFRWQKAWLDEHVACGKEHVASGTRVAYFDADTLIRDDAPSIFDAVTCNMQHPTCNMPFGCVLHADSFGRKRFARHRRKYTDTLRWWSGKLGVVASEEDHINSGVLVFDPHAHAAIFAAWRFAGLASGYRTPPGLQLVDEMALSVVLQRAEFAGQVQHLPRTWNHQAQNPPESRGGSMRGYVYHFCGNKAKEKKLIEKTRWRTTVAEFAQNSAASPLVTAVMVTGGDPSRRPMALDCIRRFGAQTYPRAELLVINQGGPLLSRLNPQAGVREVLVSSDLNVSQMRNLAWDHAAGELMICWDDDDVYAPDRISQQVAAYRGKPVALRRELIVGEAASFAPFISRRENGGWPNTLLWPRACQSRYEPIPRGGDNSFWKQLHREYGGIERLENDSWAYIRRYHGSNIWPQKHFASFPRERDLTEPEQVALRQLLTPHASRLKPQATFRLLDRRVVGAGQHRSGWPVVIDHLARQANPHARILLDDFADATFTYRPQQQPYNRPWVGMFHHPVRIDSPLPGDRKLALRGVQRHRHWAASRKHLAGAVALCDDVADELRRWLAVPVASLLHPTAVDAPRWDAERAMDVCSIVQVGYCFRNTQAIFQFDASGWRRAQLFGAIDNYAKRDERLRRLNVRPGVNWQAVERLGRIDDASYDNLLASSVVLTELYGAAANNLVVECMVRGTPLLVNRLPAVEQYLGGDYPLYFDRLADIPGLLDRQRLVAAHEHLLAAADRLPSFEQFAQQVAQFVESI